MTDYQVLRSGKNTAGDITKLCGDWGSVSKADAITLINLGHRFYVPLTNGSVVFVSVVQGQTGPYLRTNWDGTQRNNLDDLQDC